MMAVAGNQPEVALPERDVRTAMLRGWTRRCPSCGGRVYKAETLARIESVMRNESVDRRLNRRMI